MRQGGVLQCIYRQILWNLNIFFGCRSIDKPGCFRILTDNPVDSLLNQCVKNLIKVGSRMHLQTRIQGYVGFQKSVLITRSDGLVRDTATVSAKSQGYASAILQEQLCTMLGNPSHIPVDLGENGCGCNMIQNYGTIVFGMHFFQGLEPFSASRKKKDSLCLAAAEAV